jgi:hypothetical protein
VFSPQTPRIRTFLVGARTVSDPGSSPNRAHQHHLFELLADSTVRTIIRRTNDDARTQQWLIQNIAPKARTRIGNHLRSLLLLGVIDGSPDRGYRLAAAEINDILDLVHHSALRERLWKVLRKPVGRALFAALLHQSRTESELLALGDTSQQLQTLVVAGAVREMELPGRILVYDLVDASRYAQILGGIDVVVAEISRARAAGAADNARSIAYPDAVPDDYEPRVKGPRDPPDHVPRLMSQDDDATPAQRAAARIWTDLESPGLGDPHTIGRFKRSLTGLPHRPYPWIDAHPTDVAYFDLPGVAQAMVCELPVPSGTEDVLRTVTLVAAEHRGAPLTPSASQVRGIHRRAVLTSGADWRPEDLHPPRIVWTDDDRALHAATFDVARNILYLETYWRPLLDMAAQWVDQPASLLGWIERTIRFQHALKLVECIIQHEHAAGQRAPAPDLPQLTPDALTAAAYWSATERQELRRRAIQHCRAHRAVKPKAPARPLAGPADSPGAA